MRSALIIATFALGALAAPVSEINVDERGLHRSNVDGGFTISDLLAKRIYRANGKREPIYRANGRREAEEEDADLEERSAEPIYRANGKREPIYRANGKREPIYRANGKRDVDEEDDEVEVRSAEPIYRANGKREPIYRANGRRDVEEDDIGSIEPLALGVGDHGHT